MRIRLYDVWKSTSMVLRALLCNRPKLSHRTARKFGLRFTKYRYLQCSFMVLCKHFCKGLLWLKIEFHKKKKFRYIRPNRVKIKSIKRVCCLQAFIFCWLSCEKQSLNGSILLKIKMPDFCHQRSHVLNTTKIWITLYNIHLFENVKCV